MVQNRELTRRIAGFPMTDAECDIAEGVAARILAKHFTTEPPMVCSHINHQHPALLIPCPECGKEWKFVRVPDFQLTEMTQEFQDYKTALGEIAGDEAHCPLVGIAQEVLKKYAPVESELPNDRGYPD